MKNCTISKSLMMAAALLGAVTFSACSRDDDIPDNERSVVRFTSPIGYVATPQNISVENRAAGTTWALNDSIGIFMMTEDKKAVVEGTVNKKYKTLLGDINFTAEAGNIIYYPMNGSKVNFIAYYPYRSDATLGSAINVAVSTEQTAENQPTYDLLYATTTAGYSKTSAEAVFLVFHHQLTKLVINTIAGTGLSTADLAKMTVKISKVYTTNKFDLSTGLLEAVPTVPNDITPRVIADGSAYDAIIMPATFAANAISVVFTLDKTGEPFTWVIPAGTFAAGKVHTYDITLARTGITFTGTITDWDTGTGGTGIAN